MKRLLKFLKKILPVFIILTGVLFMALSCSPARKPIKPDNKILPKTMPKLSADQARLPAREEIPSTPAELHRTASSLAAMVSGINGVSNAYVALANNTAYVGLETRPELGAERLKTVKEEVSDRIKRADRRVINVYVTTDEAALGIIKKVARGVANGTPVSEFTWDITEIERRLAREYR